MTWYRRTREDQASLVAIWLEHISADGTAALLVCTHDSQPFGTEGSDSLILAAEAAAGSLVDLTLPRRADGSFQPEPSPGFDKRMGRFARAQSSRVGSWQRHNWAVDGAEMTALAWHFGGAWTGVVELRHGAYLLATGIGVDPATVDLATVADDSRYGVTSFDELDSLGVSKARYQAANAHPPRHHPTSHHPDWLAVIRTN